MQSGGWSHTHARKYENKLQSTRITFFISRPLLWKSRVRTYKLLDKIRFSRERAYRWNNFVLHFLLVCACRIGSCCLYHSTPVGSLPSARVLDKFQNLILLLNEVSSERTVLCAFPYIFPRGIIATQLRHDCRRTLYK